MKSAIKKYLWAIYLPLSVIYSELIMQLWCFHGINAKGAMYAVLFGIAAACLALVVCLISSGEVFRKVHGVVLFLCFLLYGAQAVYFRIFKAFLSLTSVGQAGTVLENFWREALTGIFRTLPMLVLLLLPTIFWLIFGRKFQPENGNFVRARAAYAMLFLVFQVTATVLASSDTAGVMSISYLYSGSYVPELSVRYFGCITNLKQDLLSLPHDGLAQTIREIDQVLDEHGKTDEPADDNPDVPAMMPSPAPEPSGVEYGPHILEIDFDDLIENESDPVIKDMHRFFSEAEPSYENEYTGLWEGKNLIWIVAEGFSSWAVDETHTPTLYKLANSGFVFENYYNPLWYVSTSDGEFTTLLSLLPRSGVWSMSRSSRDLMPFGMGNILSEYGYTCSAFHNGWVNYYDRNLSHPNLGYDFKARGGGLEVSDVWPPSDLEMIQNSVPMYIGSQPFHTYYMTISGHMYYTFTGNMQAAKHEQEVADLPYSSSCRAYVACNMELDRAIEELINELDKAGILENTAIVLSGDHYPYALEYKELDELNGGPVERNFELYHSTLIMWCADMDEPVYVDKPCYSLDVMPTICNLMGVSYDSRLVMGRDILSDSEPLIIFGNRSFLTGKGRYNASADVFIPDNAGEWESEDEMNAYALSVMQRVNEMFDVSKNIIEYDYYAKIFNKG